VVDDDHSTFPRLKSATRASNESSNLSPADGVGERRAPHKADYFLLVAQLHPMADDLSASRLLCFGPTEIGCLELRILCQRGGVTRAHDAAGFQDISPVGDGERKRRHLVDQKYGDAIVAQFC
jgi:hypothetical protein